MAYQVFSWLSDNKPKVDVKHDVATAQFGDGFKQTAGLGINNRRETWDLTFYRNTDIIKDIKNFLDDHKGYLPFEWETPYGDTILVSAKDYSVNLDTNWAQVLSVTFTQEFDS